ncbi:MAG: DHA2 family efflux MFS transporter permease subunit [Burkholderiaceae bacterium]
MAAPQTLEMMQARYGGRYRWYVLLTVMSGMMAAIVSSTIVNVAVPDMSRAFELTQSRAQWIAAAFMMAMTLALPLTPSLLQRLGLFKTYVIALCLLMSGGILGGFSPNYELLIVARVIEGFAAGFIQPIPNIIILRAFEPREQGRAMGFYGLGVVLAPAMGPTVGGLLVEAFGWRSIFFFVVPVCLAALLMSHRFLARTSSFPAATRRFDWRGLALLATVLLLLQNGLVQLGEAHKLGHWMISVSILLGAWFSISQWHRAEPLVQVRLFSHRTFAMGMIVAFVYGIGLFGSTYLVPVFLQTGLGYSPSAAGAALMPAGFTLAVTVFVSGRLADRFEAAYLVCAGVSLLTLSMLLLSSVDLLTPYLHILLFIMVGRVGLGLVLPSLMLGVSRGLARDETPQAVSMLSLLRQLGGALGISLVGLLIDWRMRAVGIDPGIVWRNLMTGQGAPGPVIPHEELVQPFAETLQLLALISAPAIIAAVLMRPARDARRR